MALTTVVDHRSPLVWRGLLAGLLAALVVGPAGFVLVVGIPELAAGTQLGDLPGAFADAYGWASVLVVSALLGVLCGLIGGIGLDICPAPDPRQRVVIALAASAPVWLIAVWLGVTLGAGAAAGGLGFAVVAATLGWLLVPRLAKVAGRG